jgi:uncharacterized flavoprotein (TIGR03862 family)
VSSCSLCLSTYFRIHMNKETVTAKQQVNIIGGGAAALFLACQLDPKKFSVTIYEKNAALARKFLVAGKGGFNLTHSEDAKQFIEKYHPKEKLQAVFQQFDNVYFMQWLNSIGIKTIVGSSKRVFPTKEMKPIEVLKAIESVLKKNGVEVRYGVEFKGWGKDGVVEFIETRPSTSSGSALSTSSGSALSTSSGSALSTSSGSALSTSSGSALSTSSGSALSTSSATNCSMLREPQHPNTITIFALGGSSWKVTGSDGKWQDEFKKMGIETVPFQASNCAFKVEWSSEVKNKLDGKALKNVAFSCGSKKVLGESVITQFGIEGSGVYPLSRAVRMELEKNKKAIISVDLKPELSTEKILALLKNRSNLSVKEVLIDQVKLSDTAFQLIKLSTSKEEYNSEEVLCNYIKNFPITVLGLAPIDEAISTVGGVAWDELNEHFELKKIPGTYCIGEMLDWDAPTGGYLLQMCFSMGFGLGNYLNRKYSF